MIKVKFNKYTITKLLDIDIIINDIPYKQCIDTKILFNDKDSLVLFIKNYVKSYLAGITNTANTNEISNDIKELEGTEIEINS